MSNAKLKNTIELRKANSKFYSEKPLETLTQNIKQTDQILFYLDLFLEEMER